MLARAVSAFHLEVIHRVDWLRIAQNVVLSTTDISAEQVTKPATAFTNVQHHLSRSKNVPCILERDRQSVRGWERTIIIARDKLTDGFFGIGRRVQRFNRRKPPLGPFF